MACETPLVREEIVALVDRSGRVVGSAPRSLVRRDNLLHAGTGILVRNSGHEIYLHRRSDTKDWAPGQHDCCAGGVLKPDEPPLASAERELAEELGIVGAELRPLLTGLYEDDSTRCFEHVYQLTWDGPVSHVDEEVAWGGWVSLQELDSLLATPGWPFVPDTRHLLTRLAREAVDDYAALTSLTPGQPQHDRP